MLKKGGGRTKEIEKERESNWDESETIILCLQRLQLFQALPNFDYSAQSLPKLLIEQTILSDYLIGQAQPAPRLPAMREPNE